MPDLDRAHSLALLGSLDRAARLLDGDSSERATWLRSYIACARGDFAGAERAASALARTTRDQSLRHASSVTAGSALRQTGSYARAQTHDRRALQCAATPSQRAHALIGLAADQVGLGRPRQSARYLARAKECAPRSDWRVWTRLHWVRAELALLTEHPAGAVGSARAALGRARRAGARRHQAKSLLFLGVALRAAGRPGAERALRDAARIARRTGAAPIERVARQMLES